MPSVLISLLLALGKPALFMFLRILEKKFPGITVFVEAIIKYLEGTDNKQTAAGDLHKHCEGMFCPADLKG